jgi:hypothetical protein
MDRARAYELARWCKIPSTKSQIPNKFKIANSNDQNGPAAMVVDDAEGERRAARTQKHDRRAPRVLNFGPSNLVLVWNLVLGIWDLDPPPPGGAALAVRQPSAATAVEPQ